MGLSRYLAKLGGLVGSDGKVPFSALAATPLNKAGDAMNGNLDMQSNYLSLAGAGRLRYRTMDFNGGGYDSGTYQGVVETNSILYGRDFEMTANLGVGGVDTKYWYIQIPTGMNWTAGVIVEAFAGGWNYGQVSGYARWHVRMVNGTITVVNLEDSSSNLVCTAKAYNHNTGSNMYHRIALYNQYGRNTYWVRLRSSFDLWAVGNPNCAITNTNPIV
jgi:hypothetical protein